ncbi:HET domain-containing protein [Fusarium sp. LHS14.1]|nr:HET domain-containing protein [Fusarium sp. LHS14.1]
MTEPFPDLSLRNWRFKGGIEVELHDTSPPSGVLDCFEKPTFEGIPASMLPPPLTSGKIRVDFYPWPQDGFLKTDSIPIKRSMPGPENNDLKELIQTEILPWIQECQSQHSNCATSEAIIVPTRLIDVGADGDKMVKLVKTDQKDLSIEFLTLSYCWGKGTGNGKARTTWGNLQSRLNGMLIKDLPATIQDAITITRLMGIKYLWVDAMCIVQPNGPNDQGDWATEAGRMGDYYAGSLCCIAASCANASTEGFLRPRAFGRYELQTALFPFTEENKQGCLWTEFRPTLENGPFSERKKHPLMVRGWCLQERVLSRRVLHWTWAGLFKECRSTRPVIEGQRLLERRDSSDKPHLLSQSKSDALCKGWCEMVHDYSKMRLSYATDRMAAIWGVASLLSRKHQDDYFYGVFRSSLAQCLLWSSAGEPKEPFMFPSWSWLSNLSEIGQVDFPNMIMAMIRSEKTGTSLIREVLPNIFPTTHGSIRPGSRSDQALEVEAPFVEIKVTEKLVSFHDSVIPDDSPIFAGWGCTCQGGPVEGKPCEDGTIVYNVLLLLGGREYNGLVLIKKGEQWERVGIITLRSDDETVVQCVDGFIKRVVLV